MQPALIIVLLCSICVCALLANRLKLAPPVAFLLGGIALALVPGVEVPHIEPEHMLLFLLPPILMEAAFFTSIREFFGNIRPILLLAVGLVVVTTVTAASVMVWLVPGATWGLGLVMGAIISPPDAAAATGALRGAPIPRRVISILEGESLINDASGIVLYKFALAAVMVGTFSFADASMEFAWKAGAGAAIGLMIGYLAVVIFPLLKEPSVEILATFVPCYAAYLLAESVEASGVLAVVATGLLIGWHAPSIFTGRSRTSSEAVWKLVIFVINATAFLLVGLQLPEILLRLDYSPFFLAGLLGAVSAAAILLRFIYVYLNAYPIAWLIRKLPILRDRMQPYQSMHDGLPWQNVFLVAWTGMRGVVTLALALALPATLPDGTPFPYRDLILFLAVGVILITLVLQGITLPFITAALTLRFDPKRMQEEWLARVTATRKALAVLDELAHRDGVHVAALARIREHYQERLESLGDGPNTPITLTEDAKLGMHPNVLAENRIWQEVLRHERGVLLQMRREFTIDDEVMYDILREIDLRASSFHADDDTSLEVNFTVSAQEKRRMWQRLVKWRAA